LSDSERPSWPKTERRRGADRRKGDRRAGGDRRKGDRRSEAGWQPVPLDGAPAVEESSLLTAARQARERAVAPFSRFLVGAALEAADGTIWTGCNIENASYSLTVCAERVALLKALSEGVTAFTRLVVVAETAAPTPPCGPCRQLLWEYCGDIPVIVANRQETLGRYALADLLPLPFDRRLLR